MRPKPAGAQNFNNESPHVQKVMLKLLAVLDAMRTSQLAAAPSAVGLDPGQTTLAAAFSRAQGSVPLPVLVSQAPAASASAQPHAFDISDSHCAQAVDMQVVGQCAGDIRKRDDVEFAERERERER